MDNARILVIDDEQIIRELLDRTFKEEGFNVEAVENGEVALQKARDSFFNVLITDLKMPKVDGMEVLKRIKQANPYIEVIIITGYPTIESAVEAIKIGAFDFICKPFDVREMISIVTRCLEKQKFSINRIELSELKALFEITKTITIASNIDFILRQILGSALGAVKAKRGSLLLFDDKGKELKIKIAQGLSEEVINNAKVNLEEGVCARVIKEKKPLLVNDIEQHPEIAGKNESKYDTNSFLSMPLVGSFSYFQGKVLGVINIADKISGESFTEREQTLLCVLASQAVAAIENQKLYSQIENKVQALEHVVKELDDTQNQLIQSEKLAAVGQLAFGIAHEIRNPLGIILGGVEFLRGKVIDEDEVTRGSIEKIKDSIGRANKIVVDLLKFSRASQLDLQAVDVCGIMDEVASLIKNQAYLAGVRITKQYPQDGLTVKADLTMLRQAFFNICINAIDAMPKGGELTLNIYSEQSANNVMVEISDTGLGMPKEVALKVFDPFFTTKRPGKGTGLGLSIVHLILERHNAAINVESEENRGTKFIIRLPRDGKDAALGEMSARIYGSRDEKTEFTGGYDEN